MIDEKLLREWESLNLFNDFIFAKIMNKKSICKHLLELVLDVSIERIDYTSGQKSIATMLGSKGVRLDVFIKDSEDTIYDVELQVRNTGNLPDRAIYYQSAMLVENLKKGEDYSKIKKSYVIFICPFDLFGKGLYKYSFKNCCLEDRELLLGDKSNIIFINTKAGSKCENEELRELLEYMENKDRDLKFSYTKAIDNKLRDIIDKGKESRVQMLMATKYKFDMQDARREGMEEGIKQGIETGIKQGIETGRAKGIKQGIETGIAKGIRQGKLESIEKNIDILKRLNISDAEIFTLIKESFDIDEKMLKKLIEG